MTDQMDDLEGMDEIERMAPGKYQARGAELGALCDKKNVAYGDSYHQAGKLLAILYPNGVEVSQYQDMLGAIRVLDKLFRIATDKEAFGENPWDDIVGYGILSGRT
jgi:hypothetical protein